MTIQRIHWNVSFDIPCRKGALTIGNFDGVHRGHQALLAELARQAEAALGPAVVLTFDPHPLQLLRPAHFPPLLTTMAQRAALLEQHGAAYVLILDTTSQLLQLGAREFFDAVIRDRVQPRTIVPGFNFAFGHNREGTVETLAEFCRAAGMDFVRVPPSLLHDETISSSRIRSALQVGNVRLAAQLLGRSYSLAGKVGTGQKRGRTIGFPTANLEDIQTMIPADGVYAVRVAVGAETWPGAANIGPNPTFGEEVRKAEVHLIGFAGDLYDQTLSIHFVERLRETQSFAGVDQLVQQLHADVAAAATVLAAEVE